MFPLSPYSTNSIYLVCYTIYYLILFFLLTPLINPTITIWCLCSISLSFYSGTVTITLLSILHFFLFNPSLLERKLDKLNSILNLGPQPRPLVSDLDLPHWSGQVILSSTICMIDVGTLISFSDFLSHSSQLVPLDLEPLYDTPIYPSFIVSQSFSYFVIRFWPWRTVSRIFVGRPLTKN